MNRLHRTLAVIPLVFALVLLAAPQASAALPSKKAWSADVRAAMRGSHDYLDRRLGQGVGRPAVNLDIDNTSLASHYAPGRPVARVLRFARYARERGVRLFFNTARLRGDGRMRKARRQLERAGYRVAGICGRRAGEGLVHSKTRCRRHFVSQGYTLIANVGNRDTDFRGGYYDKAYRLPNYGNRLT